MPKWKNNTGNIGVTKHMYRNANRNANRKTAKSA
jgi:hypothetical protein